MPGQYHCEDGRVCIGKPCDAAVIADQARDTLSTSTVLRSRAEESAQATHRVCRPDMCANQALASMDEQPKAKAKKPSRRKVKFPTS